MISVHRITNHRHGPARLQAGMCIYIYIYIYIYICTRLVYTIDTVPLSYGSVCHNSTFVRLLLVYQFILNLNLRVNILLRTFKSCLGKYSIVCIFILMQFSCHSFSNQSISQFSYLKSTCNSFHNLFASNQFKTIQHVIQTFWR